MSRSLKNFALHPHEFRNSLYSYLCPLNRECKLAGKTIIEESAMLKNIAADEEKKPLSSKGRPDCSGCIDRDRKARDSDLDWIDIMLRRGMRGRCHSRDIDDR